MQKKKRKRRRYKHSESQIKVPIPWTILSQSLCRPNCHDKSLLEISEGMTEVPEVTLLYVEILGTKMAFEKRVPDKDTNHLEYISAFSFYKYADNYCAQVRWKIKMEHFVCRHNSSENKT